MLGTQQHFPDTRHRINYNTIRTIGMYGNGMTVLPRPSYSSSSMIFFYPRAKLVKTARRSRSIVWFAVFGFDRRAFYFSCRVFPSLCCAAVYNLLHAYWVFPIDFLLPPSDLVLWKIFRVKIVWMQNFQIFNKSNIVNIGSSLLFGSCPQIYNFFQHFNIKTPPSSIEHETFLKDS